MEQEVIISVRVDGYDQLAAAMTETQKLQAERKKLDAELKSGAKTEAEYTKALADNVKAVTEARAKEAELKSSIKQTTKERESATGSLSQMRAELGRLKKEYADLSKAEREAAKGTDLNKRINDLNQEVSGIEQSIGVFSRNVGNYAGSLTPLFDGLGQQIQGLGGSFTQMTGGFVQGAKGIAGGLQNSKLAASGFGKAMSAIPIFTLISAFQVLMDLMGNFDGALDGFEQAFAAIKATMGPVIEFLSVTATAAIDSIVAAFKTLGNVAVAAFKAISGDVEGAKQSLDDAAKSAGSVVDNFTKVANAATKVGGAMAEAASKAAHLTKMVQELEASEAELAYTQVRTRKQIELLELAASDRTRKSTERIALMNEAKNKALELAKEETRVSQEQAAKLIGETLLRQNLGHMIKENNQYSSEEIDVIMATLQARDKAGLTNKKYETEILALRDALEKQLDSEEKVQKVTLEYAAKTAKMRKAEEAEREQARQKQMEAAKKRAEDAKSAADEQIATMLRVAKMDAELEADEVQKMRKQQKALAMQLEQDQKAAKSKEERLLLAKKYEQDVANLETEYQNKRAAAAADAERQRQEFAASVEGQELAQIEQAQRLRLAAIEQAQADGMINQEQANAAKLEAEAMHLQAMLDYQIKYGKDTLATQSQINQARIRDAEQVAAKEKAIAQARVQVAKNVVNSMGSVLQIMAGNESANAEFQKVMALANITMSTAEAIAGIVRIASTSSPDPVTFGVQLTAGIATVLGNIAQAVSVLNSTPNAQAPAPQRAQRGGLIGGNLHAGGGTLIEAERGEAIMTRAAVGQFGPLLDQINQISGGARISQQSAAMVTAGNSLAMQQMGDAMGGVEVNVRDISRVEGYYTRPRNVART